MFFADVLEVHEAGCDALNTQGFFPSHGARLDVAGGLSTPQWGKPRAPMSNMPQNDMARAF